MPSQREILQEINSYVSPSRTRVQRKPLDGTLEEVRKILAMGIEPAYSLCKHVQFGVAHEAFERWIKLITLQPVQSVNGGSIFELDQGIGFGVIPIMDDYGIKDNLRFLLRYLHFYLNNYYMSVFGASSRSQCEISKLYVENGAQATTTGLAYHLLILETITEGFSIDFEALSQEVIQKRIKSGYTVLSDISSNIEHLTLVLLDNLATVEMVNPFYLDTSTNEVKMKAEVLKILSRATKLYNAMRTQSPDSFGLFQELQELCHQYTSKDEVFVLIMEAIHSGIKSSDRELHGCPAHGVRNNDGVTLFKALFDFSISSFRNHYSTLRGSGLKNPGRNILTSKNEGQLYGSEIRVVLEEAAEIGSFIGVAKSDGFTT